MLLGRGRGRRPPRPPADLPRRRCRRSTRPRPGPSTPTSSPPAWSRICSHLCRTEAVDVSRTGSTGRGEAARPEASPDPADAPSEGPPGRLDQVLNEDTSSDLELRDYLGVLKRRKRIVLLTAGGARRSDAGRLLRPGAGVRRQRPAAAPAQAVGVALRRQHGGSRSTRPGPWRPTSRSSRASSSRTRSAAGSARHPPVSASPIGPDRRGAGDGREHRSRSGRPRWPTPTPRPTSTCAASRRSTACWPPARRSRSGSATSSSRSPVSTARWRRLPPPTRARSGNRVSGQRQALVQQQALFKQTLDKLTVDANLASGGAQLVGSAVVPTTPIKPRPVRNAVLAAFVGPHAGRRPGLPGRVPRRLDQDEGGPRTASPLRCR